MTTYFVTNETKYYTRYESKNIDHNFGDELPRSYVPILHPISRPAAPKPEKITESVEDVVPVLSSPVLSSPVPSSNHSIPEMPSTHVASPSMIEKIVSWFQEFTNLSAWQKWFQDLVPVFFSSKKLRSFLNVFVQVLAAESLLRHLDNWGFMPAFVKNFFRWILNLDFVKNGLANLNTLVDFICDKADEFREFVVRKIMEMVALLAAVKA